MAVAVTAEPQVCDLVQQYAEYSFQEQADAFLQVELVERAAFVTKLQLLVSMHVQRPNGLFEFLFIERGIRRVEAEELVRVGEALQCLPAIMQAFAAGAFSWQQVRLLTRFATPETDVSLATGALDWTLAHLKSLADAAELDSKNHEEAHEHRSFGWRQKNNSVRFHGELPVELAAVVTTAIERVVDAEGIDELTGGYRPRHLRRADALVQLASQDLARDSHPDKATMVLHVDLTSLRDDNGIGLLDNTVVPMQTVRQLLCDSRYQLISEVDGLTVGIGRMSRTIPTAMERLLRNRDQGCRFPKCVNIRYVHGHHIQFWSEDGETNLDNLISLMFIMPISA